MLGSPIFRNPHLKEVVANPDGADVSCSQGGIAPRGDEMDQRNERHACWTLADQECYSWRVLGAFLAIAHGGNGLSKVPNR